MELEACVLFEQSNGVLRSKGVLQLGAIGHVGDPNHFVTYSACHYIAWPHKGQIRMLMTLHFDNDVMEYDPLQLFGRHLAKLRKARGWSQEKLALESQLARSYVGGIERGQRNIALVNICVLADTLGVAPAEMLNFFDADEQPKPDNASDVELAQ